MEAESLALRAKALLEEDAATGRTEEEQDEREQMLFRVALIGFEINRQLGQPEQALEYMTKFREWFYSGVHSSTRIPSHTRLFLRFERSLADDFLSKGDFATVDWDLTPVLWSFEEHDEGAAGLLSMAPVIRDQIHPLRLLVKAKQGLGKEAEAARIQTSLNSMEARVFTLVDGAGAKVYDALGWTFSRAPILTEATGSLAAPGPDGLLDSTTEWNGAWATPSFMLGGRRHPARRSYTTEEVLLQLKVGIPTFIFCLALLLLLSQPLLWPRRRERRRRGPSFIKRWGAQCASILAARVLKPLSKLCDLARLLWPSVVRGWFMGCECLRIISGGLRFGAAMVAATTAAVAGTAIAWLRGPIGLLASVLGHAAAAVCSFVGAAGARCYRLAEAGAPGDGGVDEPAGERTAAAGGVADPNPAKSKLTRKQQKRRAAQRRRAEALAAAAGGGGADGVAAAESEPDQGGEEEPQQEEENDEEGLWECAICLNDLEQEVMWLPCFHAFHPGCFGPGKDKCLAKGLRVECPICRMPVT